MKVLNIFKKAAKSTTTSKIQSLDKNQLSKVIGGTDVVVEEPKKKGLNAVNVS